MAGVKGGLVGGGRGGAGKRYVWLVERRGLNGAREDVD